MSLNCVTAVEMCHTFPPKDFHNSWSGNDSIVSQVCDAGDERTKTAALFFIVTTKFGRCLSLRPCFPVYECAVCVSLPSACFPPCMSVSWRRKLYNHDDKLRWRRTIVVWITWQMKNLDQNATHGNWATDCQHDVLSQCILLYGNCRSEWCVTFLSKYQRNMLIDEQ